MLFKEHPEKDFSSCHWTSLIRGHQAMGSSLIQGHQAMESWENIGTICSINVKRNIGYTFEYSDLQG